MPLVAQAIREAAASTGDGGILEDNFHLMINKWALGEVDPAPLPPPSSEHDPPSVHNMQA